MRCYTVLQNNKNTTFTVPFNQKNFEIIQFSRFKNFIIEDLKTSGFSHGTR